MEELKQTVGGQFSTVAKADSSSESDMDEEVDAESLTETEGKLSIAELSLQITDLMTANKESFAALQNDVFARVQASSENPIKDDWRCIKAKVALLDRHFYTPKHNEYLASLTDWTTKGYVKQEFAQEECWKWKGEAKALEFAVQRCLHLANAMESAELVFNSIMAHQDDAQFFTVSDADKELLKAKEKAKADRLMQHLDSLLSQGGMGLPGMGMGFPGMDVSVSVSGEQAAALLAALLKE